MACAFLSGKTTRHNANKSSAWCLVATRHHAELLLALCRVVFPERRAHAIYGTLDQQARTDHLKAFRKGDAPLLIVTDVAARGLDVPLVDAVINYDAPAAARLFVHRCGRAARQGRPGLAATLVEPDEMPYIVDLHACGAEIMASSRCRRVDGVCALVDVLTDAMRVAGRVDGVERRVGTHTGQGAHPGTRGRRLVGRRRAGQDFMFGGAPRNGENQHWE